jgi:hypothetical protein
MRFDGAIEAWLEELSSGRDPHGLWSPLTSLNDAAVRQDLSVLRAGNQRATIWYFTLEFLNQLWPHFLQPESSGLRFWQRCLLEHGVSIQSFHVEVGHVHCPQQKGKARAAWLKSLFSAMQASKWTPSGEARAWLVKRRISHASMSIGDIVQVGRELYIACLDGFVAVEKGELFLPPGYEDVQDDGEEATEDSESTPQTNGNAGGNTKAHGKKKQKEEKPSAAEKGHGNEARKSKGKGGRGKGGQGAEGSDGAAKDAAGKAGAKGKGRGGKDKGGKGGEQKARGKENGEPERADRRSLRTQLQAAREQLQRHQ